MPSSNLHPKSGSNFSTTRAAMMSNCAAKSKIYWLHIATRKVLWNNPPQRKLSVSSIEPQSLEAGKSFGHYEIIKQIGAGGMGEVYLAEDKKLDRKVAVKILNEKFAKHESNLQRFIKEAKAASALNHPNILVIHEIGESDETKYIVSEFIEGKTLRESLSSQAIEPLDDNCRKFWKFQFKSPTLLTAAHTGKNRSPRHQTGKYHRASRRFRENFRFRFGEIRRTKSRRF